jgi:hypothetical protein
MTPAAVTAALVLDGVRAMGDIQRAELRALLGLDHSGVPAPGSLGIAYTPARLAAEVGITPRAVRGAIARGELAAVKRGGHWIIAPESIDQWRRPLPCAATAPRRKSRIAARGPLTATLAKLPQRG